VAYLSDSIQGELGWATINSKPNALFRANAKPDLLSWSPKDRCIILRNLLFCKHNVPIIRPVCCSRIYSLSLRPDYFTGRGAIKNCPFGRPRSSRPILGYPYCGLAKRSIGAGREPAGPFHGL